MYEPVKMVGHCFCCYHFYTGIMAWRPLPALHHRPSQLSILAVGRIGALTPHMSGDGAEDGGLVSGIEGDEEVALSVVTVRVSLLGIGHGCLFLCYLGSLFRCQHVVPLSAAKLAIIPDIPKDLNEKDANFLFYSSCWSVISK